MNAIAPGYTLHDRIRALMTDHSFIADVPAGRAGTPDEIGATVGFLLSEGAGYMTGQTLHVNGGIYLPG